MGSKTSMLASVTDKTFDREVLAAEGTVIVDFWAEWCPPCRAVAPILEKIAEENPDTLRIVKLNADDNMESAAKYHAMALPTMVVFQGGKVVKTIVGAKPKGALEMELAPFLS